ncbi:hypothetical protein T484DRAFT_1883462 [Baffinella frigidus]|nr:hypothetical protein T484DRAFT_1883462 [Cryptophyta sp. CCMP2293]
MAGVLGGFGARDPFQVRKSRLDHGAELRQQMEADRNRRKVVDEDRRQPSISPPREPRRNDPSASPPRQRLGFNPYQQVPAPKEAYAGNPGPQNQPGRGPAYVAPPAPYAPAVPSGAAQGDRLPAIRAPSPRPGGRRPGSAGNGAERRPRSGAGERRRPRSSHEAGEVPPGLQGEQNSSLIGVLQTEVQHLTQQVQELLVGIHGRVHTLEKESSRSTNETSGLRERLQTVEMENSALRAEQKGMAPSERMSLLERDVAQKLHSHLEHVTSVESARMAEAMEKVHEINERALEDRREKEAMAGRLQEQTALAKALESRLNEIETSEVSALRRGAEEFAKVSDARARLELRVSQLEGSLQLLSVRGEQVARDTGDAVKNLVETKETSILGQLQGAVNGLTLQMQGVQLELEQRGAELRMLTESEGKRRAQDMMEMAAGAEGQARSMRDSIEELRRRIDTESSGHAKQMEEASESMQRALDAAEAIKDVQLQKMRGDISEQKQELSELSVQALEGVETSRAFLEEVVRAEIRGRMQGQQALTARLSELEEIGRVNEAMQAFQQESNTVMKLLQAKSKAHGKSIKALSAEVDSSRKGMVALQGELEDEVRACVGASKASETRLTQDVHHQAQAARDLNQVMEARTRALEEGRGAIMEKMYKEVEGNRRADMDRDKATSDRLVGLQQAVDGCVEMCQSDLRDLHEAVDAVETRLDKEAEALEDLMDKTARDLASTLDDRLQASMKAAVENMSEDLNREVEKLAEGQTRVEAEQETQMRRIEANRKGMEQRAKQAEARTEEMEHRLGVEVKRVRDEVGAQREGIENRIDALDEAHHETHAALEQNTSDSIERQQILDVKLKRLEYTLLGEGSKDGRAGGAGLVGRLQQEVDEVSQGVSRFKHEMAANAASQDEKVETVKVRQEILEKEDTVRMERAAGVARADTQSVAARVESEAKALWAQLEQRRKDANQHRRRRRGRSWGGGWRGQWCCRSRKMRRRWRELTRSSALRRRPRGRGSPRCWGVCSACRRACASCSGLPRHWRRRTRRMPRMCSRGMQSLATLLRSRRGRWCRSQTLTGETLTACARTPR